MPVVTRSQSKAGALDAVRGFMPLSEINLNVPESREVDFKFSLRMYQYMRELEKANFKGNGIAFKSKVLFCF